MAAVVEGVKAVVEVVAVVAARGVVTALAVEAEVGGGARRGRKQRASSCRRRYLFVVGVGLVGVPGCVDQTVARRGVSKSNRSVLARSRCTRAPRVVEWSDLAWCGVVLALTATVVG